MLSGIDVISDSVPHETDLYNNRAIELRVFVTRRGGHREKNVDDMVNSFATTAVIHVLYVRLLCSSVTKCYVCY